MFFVTPIVQLVLIALTSFISWRVQERKDLIKAVFHAVNVQMILFSLYTVLHLGSFFYGWYHGVAFYAYVLAGSFCLSALRNGLFYTFPRFCATYLTMEKQDTAVDKFLSYLVPYVVRFCPVSAQQSSESTKDSPIEEVTKKSVWPLVGRIFLAVLLALIVFAAGVVFFVSRWFVDYFGILTADQLLFMIMGGNGDATVEANAHVINFMVAPSFISLIAAFEFGIFISKLRWRLLGLVVSIALLGAASYYSVSVLPIFKIISMYNEPSEFVVQHYVDPALTVSFPEKKRNLIHIYMESIENSFYDRAHGGYDDRNLMPDLLKLNEKSVYFSPHADKVGGPHQTFGSPHSIAAMVNMEAGSPLVSNKFKPDGSLVYPNFSTLGDLLAHAGYQNEIMLGADAKWGGLKQWYEKHGDFKVFDHEYALKHKYIPEGYKEWWGYEDDKLYEFAKEELKRLASEGKPFYFILENADTHFPDGYMSKNMKEKPFPEQYANVIFYSQAEVVKFVEWVQQQDFYENTTIVITGDHRSMDKKFFENWDPAYERTIVNMYINAAVDQVDPKVMYNRQFAPFDLFPTTLRSIGCNILKHRAGLGTDLFSGEPTLVERLGVETIDEELAKYTDYYFAYTPREFAKR